MRYTIGIDIGTSGTKTVIFDEKGKKLASSTEEYPLYQPQNGWAEQNPEDWWNAVCKTLSAVTKASGVNPNEITGIGLSGQMHGLVMLDKDNRVLRPSIIWCDGRTTEECADIESTVGHDNLIAITANPALPGFTASKIMWVKKHEPHHFANCKHILLPKDYIRFKLCGVYATEVSDASGMQLLDVPKRCWSQKILDELEIPIDWLGKVYESIEITGKVTEEAAQLCGIPAGIPVVGGGGDNACAAVGEGVVRNGKAFTTIGTSGVVYAHTDAPIIDPLGRVHTFCCAVPGAWHVMGVTQGAGLSLRWFRDQFCQEEIAEAAANCEDPYEAMCRKAAVSPIGANKLFYLPYLMGERTPHLDANARGVFFGLSAMHQKGDLIRAVLEGVGYSLRDCLTVLNEMGISTTDMRICGGGGKSPLWRSIIADIYALPVQATHGAEGAALGAAIIAMVGTGIYSSLPEACDTILAAPEITENTVSNCVQYDKYYSLYRNLYTHLKEDFSALAGIN